MKYPLASADEVRQAQAAHNLYISGVFLFNLLMTPALIALKVGMAGLLAPLACSGALLGYIHWRSRRTTSEFIATHWYLAWQRGRLLLLGYAISAALIFIAWLVTLGMRDPNMADILWTALTRVALMPTLILVLVTAVLEFGAYAQAGKREAPEPRNAGTPAA